MESVQSELEKAKFAIFLYVLNILTFLNILIVEKVVFWEYYIIIYSFTKSLIMGVIHYL